MSNPNHAKINRKKAANNPQLRGSTSIFYLKWKDRKQEIPLKATKILTYDEALQRLLARDNGTHRN